MQMSGEVRIPAPREKVWEALNDPEVLRQSIPGCQSLEKNEDGGFDAKVKAKVGPVSATFSGHVTLDDLNPPESYTLSGEGKGGAAGFAKGNAKVRLTEEGEATLLSYDVDAKVGGKLAQIGSRLIDGTAKKLSGEFFDNFSKIVAGGTPEEMVGSAEPEAATAGSEHQERLEPEGAEPEAATQPEAPGTAGTERKSGLSPLVWIAALIGGVIVLLLLFGGT